MRHIFAFALVAATTLFAGCAGDPCDVDGATRCGDAAAETCVNGAWEVTQECSAGQSCMQMDDMADGEAHCM